MQYKSKTFNEIAAHTTEDYTQPPKSPMSLYWFKKIAPKWRNRVGLPRLIAEAAMLEALGTLRSINRGIFRNDPEMRECYDAALDALNDLAGEFARQNWRRFQGGEGDE